MLKSALNNERTLDTEADKVQNGNIRIMTKTPVGGILRQEIITEVVLRETRGMNIDRLPILAIQIIEQGNDTSINKG